MTKYQREYIQKYESMLKVIDRQWGIAYDIDNRQLMDSLENVRSVLYTKINHFYGREEV